MRILVIIDIFQLLNLDTVTQTIQFNDYIRYGLNQFKYVNYNICYLSTFPAATLASIRVLIATEVAAFASSNIAFATAIA